MISRSAGKGYRAYDAGVRILLHLSGLAEQRQQLEARIAELEKQLAEYAKWVGEQKAGY